MIKNEYFYISFISLQSHVKNSNLIHLSKFNIEMSFLFFIDKKHVIHCNLPFKSYLHAHHLSISLICLCVNNKKKENQHNI